MTTVNSPSQLKHETSEFLTITRTLDRRNSQIMSKLLTNQPENNNFTITGQIPDMSSMNTEHIRYCQISKKSVSSFVSQILKTHMGWLKHL